MLSKLRFPIFFFLFGAFQNPHRFFFRRKHDLFRFRMRLIYQFPKFVFKRTRLNVRYLLSEHIPDRAPDEHANTPNGEKNT